MLINIYLKKVVADTNLYRNNVENEVIKNNYETITN